MAVSLGLGLTRPSWVWVWEWVACPPLESETQGEVGRGVSGHVLPGEQAHQCRSESRVL